jgi:hypothetical protein
MPRSSSALTTDKRNYRPHPVYGWWVHHFARGEGRHWHMAVSVSGLGFCRFLHRWCNLPAADIWDHAADIMCSPICTLTIPWQL